MPHILYTESVRYQAFVPAVKKYRFLLLYAKGTTSLYTAASKTLRENRYFRTHSEYSYTDPTSSKNPPDHWMNTRRYP